jgi:hypothetical protein
LELLKNLNTLDESSKRNYFFAIFFADRRRRREMIFWTGKTFSWTFRYVVSPRPISCSLMGEKIFFTHQSLKTAFSEELGWILLNRTRYFIIYTALHPRMTQALSKNGVFGFQHRQTI